MNLPSRLRAALTLARSTLLAARNAQGHWTGELSSSALSTATAVCALTLCERHGQSGSPRTAPHISCGLDWLAAHANADGGWGDTTLSLSNISTTTLCWAAFGMVSGAAEKYQAVVERAERWLRQYAGSLESGPLSAAIIGRYGNDRTFSVPILTTVSRSVSLSASSRATLAASLVMASMLRSACMVGLLRTPRPGRAGAGIH